MTIDASPNTTGSGTGTATGTGTAISGPMVTTAAPAAPPLPPYPPLLHLVLTPTGLRPGWGLLLFVTLFIAIIYPAGAIIQYLHHTAAQAGASHHELGLSSTLINSLLPFFVTCIVSWIMSRIEGRPPGSYGLGGRRKLLNLASGLAWGVTFLSLLVFTLIRTGLLIVDSRLLFRLDVLRYGASWLIGFLAVALLEEYLTRGYLLFTLARGLTSLSELLLKTRHSGAIGFWIAAVILSTLFGLGHGSNPNESPIGLLSAGLASLVFCLSLWRTGSLWWAIGFHTTWDWGQSFLYGVADSGTMIRHHLLSTHPQGRALFSGGATGPEGSIFVLGILTLCCLVIRINLPRSRFDLSAVHHSEERPLLPFVSK